MTALILNTDLPGLPSLAVFLQPLAVQEPLPNTIIDAEAYHSAIYLMRRFYIGKVFVLVEPVFLRGNMG